MGFRSQLSAVSAQEARVFAQISVVAVSFTCVHAQPLCPLPFCVPAADYCHCGPRVFNAAVWRPYQYHDGVHTPYSPGARESASKGEFLVPVTLSVILSCHPHVHLQRHEYEYPGEVYSPCIAGAKSLAGLHKIIKSEVTENPLRLFGFPCTWTMMKAVVAGSVSASVVAASFLYSMG